MTTIAVRLIAIVLILSGVLPLKAQFNPTVSAVLQPSPPRHVKYHLSNAGQNPASFYMFGDGHYSSAKEPLHQMETGGNFITKALYVEPYKVDKPTPRSVPIGVPNPNRTTGSSTAQPFMGGQSIRVGQSWSAALDNELVYIISFTHPCSNQDGDVPAEGIIEFHLDDGAQINQVYPAKPGWANHDSTRNSTITGFGKKIIWSYQNLAPGEIRHLYVHIDIPAVFSKTAVSRLAKIEVLGQGSPIPICDATDSGSSDIKRYPHDPNSMEVDYPCLRSELSQSQELEYTVNFQNEGNWYANNITIDIFLQGEVVISSAELDSSSKPCTITDDGTMIQIQFNNAMLPGSNQTVPNTYSYDQTTGFVKFRICTLPDVPPGAFVFGDANIFFDSQPGILTNTVSTSFESTCPIGPDCMMDRSLTENEDQPEPVSVKAYPNPFNETLSVDFQVDAPEGAEVLIRLRSINGMDVMSPLHPGIRPFGPHSIQFEVGDLPKGLYFLETQIGGQTSVQKITKF